MQVRCCQATSLRTGGEGRARIGPPSFSRRERQPLRPRRATHERTAPFLFNRGGPPEPVAGAPSGCEMEAAPGAQHVGLLRRGQGLPAAPDGCVQASRVGRTRRGDDAHVEADLVSSLLSKACPVRSAASRSPWRPGCQDARNEVFGLLSPAGGWRCDEQCQPPRSGDLPRDWELEPGLCWTPAVLGLWTQHTCLCLSLCVSVPMGHQSLD